MAVQLFKNNATTTLGTALTVGGATITVGAGQGSRFPNPTAGDYFLVTLFEKDGLGNEFNYEIVQVLTRSGDVFTSIVRDFEGTIGVVGGSAYPSAVGLNPSLVTHIELRHTAYAAGNTLNKDGNLVGLANTATARANLGAQATLVSATNIKSINSNSILGSGDLVPTFTDTNPIVKGSVDATKQMRFEVDGLTTATTRVITVPNADITIAAAGANSDITSLSAIAIGSAALPSYSFTADPNTGTWSPAADTWAVSTGGVERMRISTNGNLGFGTSTTTAGKVSISAGTAATGNSGFFINLDGVNNPYLQIQHSSAGTKLYASSSSGGAASNLVISSGGSDACTFSGNTMSVASGITFPGTVGGAITSKTLTDYEEGTWTPTLRGDATIGVGTYSQQTGTYLRIGKQVTLFGSIVVTAHTGTGTLMLNGFPFSAATGRGFIGIVHNLGLAAGSTTTIAGFAGTQAYIFQNTVGSSGAAAGVAMDVSFSIQFCLICTI